jgi:hypothetical protein
LRELIALYSRHAKKPITNTITDPKTISCPTESGPSKANF